MKLKITFIIFLGLLNYNMFSQIIPYIPIEFVDLTPKWTHVSIDSTLIDEDKYDGMTHLSFVEDYPLPYLIDGNNLYIVSNTRIKTNYENEGVFIEKLDISTGQTIWTNHFDYRNNSRQEYVESVYINKKGNLEVVSDRKINKPKDSFGHIFYGDTALLSIRNYSILNGELLSHEYSNSSDTHSLRIRYSSENRTILFPLKNEKFLYIKNSVHKIEQFLIDKNGYLLAEPMLDSVTFENSFNPDSIIFPHRFVMLKISKDTLLVLNLLYDKDDKQGFEKQAKLTLYDKSLNIKKVLKIDSILPERYDFIRIDNADKNHIYLSGRYEKHIGEKDTFFYYIFNWDGEVKKRFTSMYYGEYISLETTYLEREQEFIAVGISEDWTKLKFFITKQNEGLTLQKEFVFKENGRVFTPYFIKQLDNGDILLKGYNRLANGGNNYLLWHTWIRIKAEDLGLIGTYVKENYKNKTRISIFPTPARNHLTITTNEAQFNRIIIYDILGRVVHIEKFSIENKKTISIDYLNKGLYIANIYINNFKIGVKKFIKD